MPKKLYPLAFISLFIFLLFFLGFVVSETFEVDLPAIGKFFPHYPKSNTIYLGVCPGNTFPDAACLFAHEENEDPYIGSGVSLAGWGFSKGSLKDIKNPKKAFSLDTNDFEINDFIFDSAKNNMYVFIQFPKYSKDDDYIFKLFKVNLSTRKSSEVWFLKGNSSEYGAFDGSGMIFGTYIRDIYNDKYLCVDLIKCCEEDAYSGSVLLNLDTGKDIYFGKMGNLQVDISKQTFSYQKLTDIREPCGEDFLGHPNCDADGYWLVPKPMGPVYVEELP